jgi:hypothetical protein
MRAFDVLISWLKPRVAPVYDAGVVPHPHADLVEADPGAGEEARERVPHSVWSDPIEGAPFSVIVERTSEIVSVSILAVPDKRLQHKRLAQAVFHKECAKVLRERDGSLLAIFEVHGGSFPQMQQPSP